MKKAKLFLAAYSLFFVVALTPATVSAASQVACTKAKAGFLAFPTWYKYLNPTFVDGECRLEFAFPDDIAKVLLAAVEILLRIAVLVAVGFIIYGGFQYLISQAEPDKTKNARWTIINAVIGLAITVFATAIVNFVGTRLT